MYLVCLFVFIFIIYFLFPETKDRTLEEIAVVFDGPNSQINQQRVPNAKVENLGAQQMKVENEAYPEDVVHVA